MDKLVERIDIFRQQRGWTQYVLAAKSGIPQSTIATWYGTKKIILPSVDSLRKLAQAYDTSVSLLFVDSGTEGNKTIEVTESQLELLLMLERFGNAKRKSIWAMLEELSKPE
jgi:transcriptional regulator with XRE-family HTH domain